MTGLPYNIQAGTLGIDQEDPEKRLLSNTGGMLLSRLKKTRQQKAVGGKIHNLYDYLEIDATPSLGKDVTIKEKFYRGGKVQRALLNARR